MARNWTEEQLSAIAERENTLLLSAAAGSGKTATLTERLIRMITDEENPAHIAEMLIVTFTRAAAKELRERIGAALAAALEKDPDNRRLAEEMLLLPTARIRTIDSFCQDLVRGHTDLLGIPAAFRVGDVAEISLLSSHVMEDLLEDAYRGLYAPEGLALPLCAECLVGAREEGSLASVLLSLYDKLCGFREGVELLKKDAEKRKAGENAPFFSTPWGNNIAKRTRRIASDLLSAYRKAQEEAEKEEAPGSVFFLNYGASVAYDLSFLADLIRATEADYNAVRVCLSSYDAPAVGRKRGDPPSEAAGRLKALRTETGARIKKLLATFFAWEEGDLAKAFVQSAAVEKTLYLLLSEFARRFAEEKRRRNLCDYNDLEHFALALLLDEAGNRTPLAESMAASFSAVCIDEYQDVNEIQHLIFEALSTDSNRFMVGDIKQSIYGFRGAQPAIFEKLRRTFPTEEHRKVLYLTRNFRSLPPVIDFCNAVFDFLFGVYGESVGYLPEDRLRAGRMPEEGPRCTPAPLPVFTFLSEEEEEDGEEDGEKAEERTESAEAAYVAGQIAHLLQEGKKQNGEPLCPGDIAILLRSGVSRANRYTAALQKAGVPVQTEDRESFFGQKEVLLAICLLQTVNNPLHDIYLAGLLRSPLYGFTMEELLNLRQSAPADAPLFLALKAYSEAHPDFTKGRAFLADLALYREVAEGMPSDRLIRFLYDKTMLLRITTDKERRNLLYLYDCAKQYEAASFHGLYRFLGYLNDLMQSGRDLGGKRMVGEENGVSIITMHHSKGLEFPVCFLPECGSALRPAHPAPLVFEKDLGAGFFLRDESGLAKLENPLNLSIRAAVAEREIEEEVRVLYVAMTRAKEQLYMVASPGRRKPETVLSAADFLRRNPAKTFLSSAASYAEWVLAALGVGPQAADGFSSPLFRFIQTGAKDPNQEEDLTQAPSPLAENGSAGGAKQSGTADGAGEESGADGETEKAAALLRERFSFVYPHVRLPGKLSVSRLYPTLLDGEEPATPANLFPGNEAVLLPQIEGQRTPERLPEAQPTYPKFLSGKEKDPAALAGTATHIFLQFCDFSALLFGTHGNVCNGGSEAPGGVCNNGKEAPGGVCNRTDKMSTKLDKSAWKEEKTAFFDGREVPFSRISDPAKAENAGERVKCSASDADVDFINAGERVKEEDFLASAEKKEIPVRVKAELERLCTGRFITAEDANRVRQNELVAFAISPLAARIRAAAKILREFRFNVFLPAEDFAVCDKEQYRGEKLFVQGVIDLLLFDKDGQIILVDYKTDRIPRALSGDRAAEDAFLLQRHRQQLLYYRQAVREIFGRSPVKTLIYSLALGREIEVGEKEP